ncbi:MAG: hypothetical protein ACKO7W_08390 [Elainella sp.]
MTSPSFRFCGCRRVVRLRGDCHAQSCPGIIRAVILAGARF